jgi:Cu+-exporting ATPase
LNFEVVRAGFANMDVLITLGVTASFAFSAAAMALGRCHVMFDTIPMLLAFQLCGRYLQARAEEASTRIIDKLATAQTSRAHLLLGRVADLVAAPANITTAETVEVDAELLREGDVVRVAPGQTVPCDGTVLASSPPVSSAISPAASAAGVTTDESSSLQPKLQARVQVDESTLTGESHPISKGAGDTVSAGTIVVSGGSVVVRAVRVGPDTTIARILETVEMSHLNLHASSTLGIVDKLAAQMVPAVIAVAAFAGLFWFSFGTYLFPKQLFCQLLLPCGNLTFFCPSQGSWGGWAWHILGWNCLQYCRRSCSRLLLS